MSAALISRSPDLAQLEAEGFELEIRANFLLVHSVPYVDSQKRLRRGMLLCALTRDGTGEKAARPSDHTMYFDGEVPCHIDGRPISSIVNNSSRTDLGGGLIANHYLSSKPEGGGAYDDYYTKVVAYEHFLAAPARHFDPSANARTGAKAAVVVDDTDSPFVIPDTATARYGIGAISRKLSIGKVAIVGLGGTGAYVLDLLAKTPVREIHLFDADQYLNHNIFRSPGARQLPRR